MIEKVLKYREKFQKEKENKEYEKEKKFNELEKYYPELKELEEIIKIHYDYNKDPKKFEYKLARKVKSLKNMYRKNNFQIPAEIEKYSYLEKMLDKKKLEIDYEKIEAYSCFIVPLALLSFCIICALIFPQSEPINNPIVYPLFP